MLSHKVHSHFHYYYFDKLKTGCEVYFLAILSEAKTQTSTPAPQKYDKLPYRTSN